MQPPLTSLERHRSLNLPRFYGFKASDEQLLRDFFKPFVLGEELTTCPIHTIEDVYSSTPEDLTSRYERGTDSEWFFFSGKTYRDVFSAADRVINGGVWVKQGHTKKTRVDLIRPGFKRTQAFRATSPDHAQWMMEEFSLDAESNYILAKIFRDPDQKKQNPESGSIQSTSKQTQSRHHPFQPNNTPHNFGTHPFQPPYQTHNQAQQTETLHPQTHNQAQQTETLHSQTHNQAQQTETLHPQTHNQAQQTASPFHFTQHTQTLPYQPHNQAQQTETPSQSPTADETFIYRSDQELREWRREHFLDDSNQQ